MHRYFGKFSCNFSDILLILNSGFSVELKLDFCKKVYEPLIYLHIFLSILKGIEQFYNPHSTGCKRVTVTPNNCIISWDRGVFSGLWVNQPFKILSALRICPISID